MHFSTDVYHRLCSSSYSQFSPTTRYVGLPKPVHYPFISRQSNNVTIDGCVFTNNFMGVSLNQGWSGVSVSNTHIGVDYDGSAAGGFTAITTNNRSSYDPNYCRLLPLPAPQPRTGTARTQLTQSVGSCVYQDSCLCVNPAAPNGVNVTGPCIIYSFATTVTTSCVVSVFEPTTLYVVNTFHTLLTFFFCVRTRNTT